MLSHTFKKFEENNVLIAFSDKKNGSTKLSSKKINTQNRNAFLQTLHINPSSVVSADLVHSNTVYIAKEQDKGNIIPVTDGLLTNRKNIFLSVTAADCLPIFLYDPQKEIVGLVHGGWRCLSQNILSHTIEKIKNIFNSDPKNIIVGIGPGIAQCHFEVTQDFFKQFPSIPQDCIKKTENKTFIDLKSVTQHQLISLGIPKKNIEINQECTYCLTDKYFSYRRDGYNPQTKEIDTMMAVIGINNID
ncbi:MAG: peptidoglycan editing factor PgeF [bacterium]